MVRETDVTSGLRLNQGQRNRAILRTIKKLKSWRKTKESKGIRWDKIRDL
jgi:hypothetical protein